MLIVKEALDLVHPGTTVELVDYNYAEQSLWHGTSPEEEHIKKATIENFEEVFKDYLDCEVALIRAMEHDVMRIYVFADD